MMFDNVGNGQYNSEKMILVLSPFGKCFNPPEIGMLILKDIVFVLSVPSVVKHSLHVCYSGWWELQPVLT